MNDVAYSVTFTFIWCALAWMARVHSEVVPRTRSHALRPLSDEERLLDLLFSDYNPSARPVLNSSKTVSVSIQFSLMHIKELDVRSQIFTTTGLLMLEWRDERLTWSPEEHNDLMEIIVEARGLWRPEFAVINGAEKIYEDYNQFRAVISHEGIVHWEPGGVFKTMCEIDITYYPFDDQKCVLMFGAWSYHTSKMNLTNKATTINLDSYKQNGEWDIYATPVERKEFAYDCCPNEPFANVEFHVNLRRRHTFYILNVILPSIMTSVLLLSIFFCTPGQKVQIGVVVLLSFRIFLLNVSGNIPKTSDHIPLLGIYLTCTMAITTLSMVLTVFVLNLHHITDRPVPRWARTAVFVYLARILGMCVSAKKEAEEAETTPSLDRKRMTRPNNGGFFRRSYTGLNEEGDETAAIMELQHRNNVQNKTVEDPDSPWVRRDSFKIPNPAVRLANPRNTSFIQNNMRETHNVGTPSPRYRGVEDMSRLQSNGPAKHEKEKAPDFAKDWRRMAEIFDRLFFWLFLLAILISTLILFHPLTKSYIEQPDREKHS